jgi:signal transduction histidine kinase
MPTADGSSIGSVLVVAWTAVVIAGAAVAVLLIGAMSLSERRGTFVSAVTHELRTPLTTFRLYTDLLAEGMVRDESRKSQLYVTLRDEADRLSRLIENVMAYARLERRDPRDGLESVDAAALRSGCLEHLRERAARCDLELDCDETAHSGVAGPAPRVKADPSVVEQILLNLIDNACKYASDSSDKRIELALSIDPRHARITVRDFGPGVDPARRKRLFKPFNKSARDAAHSAPGIGLGLALSRRLARDMGGDLTHDALPPGAPGASFTLHLPRVA